MKRILAIAVTCFVGLAGSACDHVGGGPSKVAHGQLYQSGDGRYDTFFQQVHEQQVAASSRAEERRNAHKAIAAALDLTPDASNETILKALKERKDKGSSVIDAPVDETIRSDLERVRRLRAIAARSEQLRENGKSLADEQKREWDNRGADKADDKKTDKRLQVRRELDAANDALDDISHDARHEAKKTDELIDDLAKRIGREVIRDAPERPAEKPEKKDPPKPKPAEPKRPPPKPDGNPQPPPAPKPPDEVFNP